MATLPTSHEFKLTLDGITLDQSTLNQITLAVQKAFLAELIALNLNKGDLVYTPIMSKMIANDRASRVESGSNGGGGGGSGGAHATIQPPAQA